VRIAGEAVVVGENVVVDDNDGGLTDRAALTDELEWEPWPQPASTTSPINQIAERTRTASVTLAPTWCYAATDSPVERPFRVLPALDNGKYGTHRTSSYAQAPTLGSTALGANYRGGR